MPTSYKVTRSGSLYRSAEALINDESVIDEMKKTSIIFDLVTGNQGGDDSKSPKQDLRKNKASAE